jgi:hypothetical protein
MLVLLVALIVQVVVLVNDVLVVDVDGVSSRRHHRHLREPRLVAHVRLAVAVMSVPAEARW